MASDGTGLPEEAGVESGLAAAGLAFGVGNLDAQAAEHAHDAHAYLRVDHVNVARYEQRHPHATNPFPIGSRPQYSNRRKPQAPAAKLRPDGDTAGARTCG